MHIWVIQTEWLSFEWITIWALLWWTHHTIWKEVCTAYKSFVLLFFCYHLFLRKLGKAMHFLIEVITFYKLLESNSNMRALHYIIFTSLNFFIKNKIIPVGWSESKVCLREVSFEVWDSFLYISFSKSIVGVIRILRRRFLLNKFI